MSRWTRRAVSLAVLSALALSSVWAWPSLHSEKAIVSQEVQEEPSEGQEPEAQTPAAERLLTGLIRSEEIASMTPSGESEGSGEIAEVAADLEMIGQSLETMKSEYDELYQENADCKAEYEALAEEHAAVIDEGMGNRARVILLPEAIYDITANEWGVGATVGVSYRHLSASIGVEKMINDSFLSGDGFRIRAGVGIAL